MWILFAGWMRLGIFFAIGLKVVGLTRDVVFDMRGSHSGDFFRRRSILRCTAFVRRRGLGTFAFWYYLLTFFIENAKVTTIFLLVNRLSEKKEVSVSYWCINRKRNNLQLLLF